MLITLSALDLRKIDLSGMNFSKVNLRGAVFSKSRLRGADFSAADLSGANLSRAILRGADFTQANLREADLSMADLRKTNLSGADLTMTNLRGTRLGKARLCSAVLIRSDLLGSNLFGADLTGAILSETLLADTLLAQVRGLDQCQHRGPSIIDYRTVQRSGPLPVAFLRGCGLPDHLIDFLPTLIDQPAQYYSCFISYSSADQTFVELLYTNLQNSGVRCWFAPEDMKIGAKILDTLDEAIRLRDKVLLVLSAHAIESDWVEDEITKAFAEERSRQQTVIFPIRIDEAVMGTPEAWVAKLRNSRNIGDFSNWREKDSFKRSFQRLLRDLRLHHNGANC